MMEKQSQRIINTYKNRNVATVFDAERSRFLYQRHKHKIESEFLKKTLREVKEDEIKILDVGCGTGRMLPEVLDTEKRIEYYGLDTSEEMIRIFRKKAKVKVLISDATDMPFKDNFFDVTFSFHLLWHLEKLDQGKILKEMRRVTKPKGVMIFDILNKNFVWSKLQKTKLEGLYKITIQEAKDMVGEHSPEIEKLNDAPIKLSLLYSIFNIVNKMRKILPTSLFHMLYFKVRKNV